MKQYIEMGGINIEYIFARYLLENNLVDLLVERYVAGGYGFGEGLGISTFDCFHWEGTVEGHHYWSELQDTFYPYRAEIIDSGVDYAPPTVEVDEREVL